MALKCFFWNENKSKTDCEICLNVPHENNCKGSGAEASGAKLKQVEQSGAKGLFIRNFDQVEQSETDRR